MKALYTLLIVSLFAVALALVGCSDAEETFDIDLSQEKMAIEDDLEQAAERIDQRLQQIEQDMENAPDSVREELQVERMRLEQLETQVEQTMADVQDQTVETWLDFRGEVDEVVDSVDAAVS